MCHSLLSSSTLSRSLAAALLLCIYVSVVMLSFTASKSARPVLTAHQLQLQAAGVGLGAGGVGGGAGAGAGAAGAGAEAAASYVTTLWSESQLPALVTLAHSLMEQRCEYGLVVLFPTGRAAAAGAATAHATRRSPTPAHPRTQARRGRGRGRGGAAASRGSDAASNSVSDDDVAPSPPQRWSSASLAILRAIPNLTLQPLPHIHMPPPPRAKATQAPHDADEHSAAESSSRGPSSGSEVSLTSAVRALLLFEVWRLTSFRRVLYLDVSTLLTANLDHLLRAELEHEHEDEHEHGHGGVHEEDHHEADQADAHAESHDDSRDTAGVGTSTPEEMEKQRSNVIDASLERWLHAHSRKDGGGVSSGIGRYHVVRCDAPPVEWADSYTSITPSYMRVAAPLQLTREDCARHDEIAGQCSNGESGSSIALPAQQPSSFSPAASAALSSSLSWSLLSGVGPLLLTPHSYTYHLLLQAYSHRHVERRDRFDRAHLARREERKKYASFAAKVLNGFFHQPCAASLTGTNYHPATTVPSSSSSSSAAASAASSRTGCWHPLRLNYSFTSHTCDCMDEQEQVGVVRYASCSPVSPWSLLPSRLVDTLKRSDQLTIHASTDAEVGEEQRFPASAQEAVRAAERGRAAAAAAAEKTARKTGMRTLAHPSSASARPATDAADRDDSGAQASSSMSTQSVGARNSADVSPSPSPSPPSSSSASIVPPSPASYYSQLLSSLSWLFSDTTDQANHRFARLYLQEQQERTMERLDTLVEPRGSVRPANISHTAPPSLSADDGGGSADSGTFLSPCCHQRYRRVLSTYFTALRFIRPNFDEPRSSNKRKGARGG